MGAGQAILNAFTQHHNSGKKYDDDDDPSSDGGSQTALQIIAEIKRLEANIQTWSKKIYDVQDQQLQDKYTAERAEMVRRLGILRHRPKIPEDDIDIISMSPYSRTKGSTSEALQLLKLGQDAGKCLCNQCSKFVPNTYDAALCKNCEHPLSYHLSDGKKIKKSDSTYPRRYPTRKELDRTAMFSEMPRTDPSYFPTTLIDQAKDAPPRLAGKDDPIDYVPPEELEPIDTPADPPSTMNPAQDDVVQDKICGTDIEQELIDAGFSAEAGRGMLTYADDSHYDGEWAVFEMGGKIERHGYGSMHYATGEIHSGDFVRDLRHGNGKLVHPDGSCYFGAWKWGEIVEEGKGAMPSEDGSGKYVGEWYDGQRQGMGTMVTVDGDSFEGEWYEDMMHGYGTFSANNGDVYTGTFVRGEMEGIGVMKWFNGDRYDGKWSNGVMHGEGTFFSGVDQSLFTGNFVDGEKIGHGVIELSSGDSYSGLFDGNNGCDTVFGVISTSDGKSFQVRPRSFRYSYEPRVEMERVVEEELS